MKGPEENKTLTAIAALVFSIVLLFVSPMFLLVLGVLFLVFEYGDNIIRAIEKIGLYIYKKLFL